MTKQSKELPAIGTRVWRLICPWGWHTVVSHECDLSFKTEEGNVLRLDDSEEVIWCREGSALDPIQIERNEKMLQLREALDGLKKIGLIEGYDYSLPVLKDEIDIHLVLAPIKIAR